jgi:ribose-phosphate pyrophosphokinase
MTIKLIANGNEVPVRWAEFSDGALQCWIDPSFGGKKYNYVSLTVCPTTPVKQVAEEISLLGNAINRFCETTGRPYIEKCYLNLPYLPYGRADRSFEPGNPSGLGAFIGQLAVSQQFTEIFLVDPHNQEKTINLFHPAKVHVTPQWACFFETVKDIKMWDVLIAPDKGAAGKTKELQEKLVEHNHIVTDMYTANKKRNIETGRVVGVELPENINVKDKVVYIVDDICDGGGTFIPLAEQLKNRNAKEVHLYVTHGIFSKGLAVLKPYIDRLHVYQVVGQHITPDQITRYNQGDWV